MTNAPLRWRPMAMGDLPRIVELERDLFSDPWPEEMFRDDIDAEDLAHAVVGAAEDGIVAYGIGWFVGNEFHIANMAVRRDRQGQGIGGRLLDEMMEVAERNLCRVVTLEVRVSNEPAIRLYRSRGFREVAIRSGYYLDNGEDALVMLREVASATGETGGLV